MSEKGLKVLSVTIGVLVVIWLAVSLLSGRGGGGGAPPDALAGFFRGVTPESVTAVRFKGPESDVPVELKRSGGRWTVNDYRADSSAVARFWESVATVEVGSLVGSNPANHPRLGVAADSAWTLDVETPDGARNLLVGKSGTRYGTTYVRLPDAEGVYLLEGGLRPVITRSLDEWRNKQVARVDTSAVQTVEVEGDGGGWTIRRADSSWVMADGSPTDGATVRSLLGELARMDASGFYGIQDSLPPLGGSVRAMDQAGDTLLLLDIGSGEGDRWARVEGDSIVYRIPSWRAIRVLPELSTLRGEG
jgi:hypothetical protein